MEFKEVINKRYSVRQYQKKKVPEKIVRDVVELAKLAPSAGNLQSYKVVITKEKITSISAPLYLIVCADIEKSAERYGDRGKNLYAEQDATIFAAYLQLALVDAGLASCWVGAFREGKIRNLLKIPENLKLVAVISLGYPIGEKAGRRRRSFEEIILSQE
jgi:nitroreductase